VVAPAVTSGVERGQPLRRLPSWSFKAARPYLGVGTLGTFLLLISGNLWTFLRRIDGSGMWEKDFWQGVGWNATRVLVIKSGDQDVDYTINEFPAFSFLLGDLHPHVLALPFVLLAVGLAYAWLMRPPKLYRWAFAGETLPGRLARWGRLSPLAELLPGALILGALYFFNSWDFPAYFVLAQAAALGGALWLRTGDRDVRWPRALGVVTLCGALALGLYLPFILSFKPPVLGDQGLPLGLVTQRSFLNQFLQFWGIQLLLIAPPLIALGALRYRGRELALAFGALTLFVAVADRLGSGALMISLALALASGYGAALALRAPERDGPDDRIAGRRPLAFALGAICLGTLLLAACEVVYIRDFYGGALRRMNTVFKLYYQAWLLLALGGAVAAYWLMRLLRARRSVAPAGALHWGYAGLGTALVVAGLHFPVRVSALRTDNFKGIPTLNGMEWMARFHPEDYAAAEWLRASGVSSETPTPVVLEATGGAYSEFSRFATQTGFPTVLGWDQHERLWRGAEINPEVDRRKADVDAAYSSTAFDQAKPILDKYGVTHVVVGYLEQQKYGAGGGLTKFQTAAQASGPLERVFSQGQTAIYKVKR
jgi:YYY domain-containing protein